MAGTNARVGKPDRMKQTFTDRVIELVGAMANGALGRLVPEPSVQSPVAYTYPEAARLLQVAPGEEIAVLDALEERGILAAEPVTTVPVCPFCRTYAIRVERTCRACGSTAVRKTTMIHHFRCGNVSPEETYRQGPALVCPKCGHTLRHLGVDYERPSRAWLCTDCSTVNDAPDLRYHSLTCGRRFPLDDVVDRQLNAYSLSPEGSALVSEGALRAAIENPAAFDALTGLPNAAAVHRTVELERIRAERYGTRFALVRFGLANGEDLAAQYGEEAAARVIQTIATIARENLRAVDTLARHDRFSFHALLPETDTSGAQTTLEKLTESVNAYLHAVGRDDAHATAVLAGEVVETSAAER